MVKVYRSDKAKKKILETYDQLLGKWGVPFEEHLIATTYGQTQVVICGESQLPPLVLFHGVGDDSALMWVLNAAALSAHYRLYAVDTLGGPGKSVPNDAYNRQFEDLVWIDELLDGLSLGRVFMAGVSNGGYLVQYYGANRPERVSKIVAMASSVPAETGHVMSTMMKIFLPEALFPTDKNVARLLRKLSGVNSQVFTGDPILMAHFTALMRGFNNMAMSFHKIRALDQEAIDQLRDRTLYLMGSQDPFATMGGRAMLEKHRMKARFFDGVGHGINHEIATEINAILIDFFG